MKLIARLVILTSVFSVTLHAQAHPATARIARSMVVYGSDGERHTVFLSPSGGQATSSLPSQGSALYASTFPGSDAGAKIQAALINLPSTGGVVFADFEGVQSSSVNPFFGITKPFKVVLGAMTVQTSVPWTLGENDVVGQYLEGLGPDVTIIRPTASFSGPAVIQLAPQGINKLFRQCSVSKLTVDMKNVHGQTAIEILSGSNLPPFRDLVIKNQNGTFVHIGTSPTPGSQIPEGITFDGWQFYARPPKMSTGVQIDNANEIVFRDGKLLGIRNEGSQVGFLIQAAQPPVGAITSPGMGFQLVNSSVAAYPTGVKLTSAGPFAASGRAQIISNTFEAVTTAIDLAGYDAAHMTEGNQVAFNRYVYPLPMSVRIDFGRNNFIIEAVQIAGPGQYTLTSNSANNMLIHPFGQSDYSDVSDSGRANVALGNMSGVLAVRGKGGSPVTVLGGGNPK